MSLSFGINGSLCLFTGNMKGPLLVKDLLLPANHYPLSYQNHPILNSLPLLLLILTPLLLPHTPTPFFPLYVFSQSCSIIILVCVISSGSQETPAHIVSIHHLCWSPAYWEIGRKSLKNGAVYFAIYVWRQVQRCTAPIFYLCSLLIIIISSWERLVCCALMCDQWTVLVVSFIFSDAGAVWCSVQWLSVPPWAKLNKEWHIRERKWLLGMALAVCLSSGHTLVSSHLRLWTGGWELVGRC